LQRFCLQQPVSQAGAHESQTGAATATGAGAGAGTSQVTQAGAAQAGAQDEPHFRLPKAMAEVLLINTTTVPITNIFTNFDIQTLQ
jgi:hypothetical protein